MSRTTVLLLWVVPGAIALDFGLANLFADRALMDAFEHPSFGELLSCAYLVAQLLAIGDYLLLILDRTQWGRWRLHLIVVPICGMLALLLYPRTLVEPIRFPIVTIMVGGMIATGIGMLRQAWITWPRR